MQSTNKSTLPALLISLQRPYFKIVSLLFPKLPDPALFFGFSIANIFIDDIMSQSQLPFPHLQVSLTEPPKLSFMLHVLKNQRALVFPTVLGQPVAFSVPLDWTP